MNNPNALDAFIKPGSVAVIGATERPGSWGSFIMEGLLSRPFPGPIYPVNRQGGLVYGRTAFKEVGDLPEAPELAIFTIPEESVEKTIRACGEKGVKGITIITAGFKEVSEAGKDREEKLVQLARSYGIRLLGPNVSGTFNLHADFNGSAAQASLLTQTRLAAVCQGGYAIYDLLFSGFARHLGVGIFVHTGNEADLTSTDFLERLGFDREVQAVIMYLETIREGRRFLQLAREVSRIKPIVIYKGGKTPNAARAAQSHTGALAGRDRIYQGILAQSNAVSSPTMELLFPLGQALVDRPPVRGNRVAILTMGGSWGVALSDALEAEGLQVAELSAGLQSKLRDLGMPNRASVRNPVDIGASGIFFHKDILLALGREMLASGEIDALIVHGLGRPGMLEKNTPERLRIFLEINKQILRGYRDLEKEFQIPVLIGTIFSPWESQIVDDLNNEGIYIFNRLDETAQVLSRMYRYWKGKS